jgi:hypothetical protein
VYYFEAPLNNFRSLTFLILHVEVKNSWFLHLINPSFFTTEKWGNSIFAALTKYFDVLTHNSSSQIPNPSKQKKAATAWQAKIIIPALGILNFIQTCVRNNLQRDYPTRHAYCFFPAPFVGSGAFYARVVFFLAICSIFSHQWDGSIE